MTESKRKVLTADNVEAVLKKLEVAEGEFLRMFVELAKAYGGAIYPVDLLASAVGTRSMLIAGFCTSIRAKNFICAASIVRLHLDSLLRFAGVWMVD